MGREEKVKKTGRTSHSFFYKLLNGFFAALVFVAVYNIWLKDENNYFQIFIAMALIGITVSWTFRLICAYYGEKNVNVQEILTNLIIPCLYAFIIWIGFIAYLFDTISKFWLLVVILMFTKFFIFLIAESISDRITFKT